MSIEHAPKEKSAAELFADLAAESAALFRQEAALVTREMSAKAALAAKQTVILLVALLLGTTSLLTLVAALVIGVSAYVAAWISALVVGLALAAIAYALYAKTVTTLSNLNPVPERAVQTLKENKSWLQQETR